MLFKLLLLIFAFQYEAKFFDSNVDFKQILGTYLRSGLTLKNEEDSLIKDIINKEKFVNSHFKQEIKDSNFRKILPSVLPSESKTQTVNNFKSEEKQHFFNNPMQPTNKLIRNVGNKYWNGENQKRRTKRDLNEKIHRKADCFWFTRTPLTTAATTTTTTTEGAEEPEAESLETSQRLSSRRRTRNRNRRL